MTSRWRVGALAGLVLALAIGGCDGAEPEPDAGTAPSDAGPAADAGTDAGPPDAGADTWSGFAEGFFATYCVGCHFGAPRDYQTIADVRRDLATIRCGVAPTALSGCASGPSPSQFPIGSGPRPSDPERTRLVEWLDAGAIE